MQIAPVAEYKGVAIAERPGNVPKHYRGVDYTKDGHTYLFRWQPDGMLLWMQLPSERVAKELIDAEKYDDYVSHAELRKILRIPPPLPYVH